MPADHERKMDVDVLLNSRLGPELLRILVTGSLFALGMLFGWLLGILRWRRLRRQAERGEAREVLTIEKILLESRPDGQEIMRIRSCGRGQTNRWSRWRRSLARTCSRSWLSGSADRSATVTFRTISGSWPPSTRAVRFTLADITRPRCSSSGVTI